VTGTCHWAVAWLDPGLCRAIDHYCERTGDGWFAEPFNALSNLAFFVAGWAAWRLLGQYKDVQNARLLILTVALIPTVGIGSFTFHTVATRWAEWLDVVPIGMFLTAYLWLAFKSFLNWLSIYRWAAVSLFLITTIGAEAFVSGTVLWGGAMYVPTIATLLFFALVTVDKENGASRVFLYASGGFLAAYTLRTIDDTICPLLPTGTHMMWHLINAVLMYFLVRSLVTLSATSRQAAPGNAVCRRTSKHRCFAKYSA